MRITKYTTYLSEDRTPKLVKEKSSNYPEICSLNNTQKIADMMNTVYNASILTEECMWLIALNTHSDPIGIFEISHGIMNAALISPREIFMKLCLCGAFGFVLVHNHPSGNCYPSGADRDITEQMKQCGKLMNINLLDHIIIGNGYYSFYDEIHTEKNDCF